ncbi:hypothetical protein GUITHDRAFT_152832 [Guillardia theta CCMP2712]|uniref:Uncharacterized protein n=1 Tax=Guillardia theta (strain CCMP2712) TaxID=905079 RepID=L1J914_GUITC|nr:hypothetical protein GUITHDRAFT_152832 [Guillardia theta CCMP2712]EKX45048.1 hypothetical protein GUITHDRAFT_152832 [Guillardia theta CCMP2712]|eukprot:XP_005832028.1 hypothetical protein GUITHDRAFT_152832 [Guillardia theta CCMP2712]
MNPLEIINEALKKESESTQPKAKVPSKPAKGSIRYMFGDKVGAKVGSLIRKVRKSEGISPRKESRGAKGVHPSILDTDKDKEAMNDLEQMDKEGLLKSVQAKQKRLERIASHGGKKVKFGEREQEAMKDLELLDKRGMLKKTSQALQGSREGDEEQEQEQDDGQDSGHSMLNLFGSQAKARYHDLTKWRSKG